MQKYEVLFALAAELDNTKKDALIEKFSKLVVTHGKGEVESVNKWGLRKLAYPINYKNEGFYVLMTYTAKADFNVELERNFRLAKDEVIRFMIERIDPVKAVPKPKKPAKKAPKAEEPKAEEVKIADEEIKEETK